MMLHQQDATLVLMNEQNPNSLYQMDIETGKVVEEWKVSDHIEVNSMAPDSKFAQMTPGQTLVGTSHNALFRIDPRVSGNKLVDSEYKQYATKAAFSSVATTDKGIWLLRPKRAIFGYSTPLGRMLKLRCQLWAIQ